MDQIDLGIFSRLVDDAFRSDESLAREVGLTGKAVRLRRRRMEAQGVLAEYGLHPRAEILGRHAIAQRYVGPDRPDLPRAQLGAVEDLLCVRRFRPGLHMVVRFPREPDPPDDPRLSRLLGRPLGASGDRLPPISSLRPQELSRVDWNVLEELVRSPRAPYSVKARRAQVSARTFRSHQARLEAGHALACSMILDLERERGVATYGLWLKVNDSFDRRAVELPRLWDRPHWTEDPQGVYLLGSADSYFEAREMELRLRSLPGVLGVDPLIPAGGFFARERVISWIRAEREARFGRPGSG